MKFISLFVFLVFSSFASAQMRPIILVLTNHSELGETGEKTGFYLSEAAHPYEVFAQRGYKVVIASPDGGFAPLDPKSLDLEDEANSVFWKKFGNGDKENPGVSETVSLLSLAGETYGAIFFAGGHGSMWDFPNSESLQEITRTIYENKGAVAAVCHGPAALINVKLTDGTHLLAGKKTAVFTNAEEEAVKLTKIVPFLLEDEFKKAGAEVVLADNFTENAVRDGMLVTGQNPASAKKTAQLLLEAIEQ